MPLFLDKDDEAGVDLDDCELISRKLSDILETEDPIAAGVSFGGIFAGDRTAFKAHKGFPAFCRRKGADKNIF